MRTSFLAAAVASVVALTLSPGPVRSQSQEGDLPAPVSTSARTVRFASASLGYEYTFAILLPARYAQTEKRYPVLYLLHPGGGSHTSFPARTWFNKHASQREMIVVLPNGGRSFFVNSVSSPNARYEDVIVKELIAYVDEHYRTNAAREGRAIAGISMGGFGAAVIGLKHPDLFATVGALSAALGNARSDGPGGAANEQIFGPAGSLERRERDPFAIASQIPTGSAPYFYLSCGDRDPLVTVNREFAEILSSRGLPHEYEEVPGAHTWDVWDAQLPRFFDVLPQQPGWSSR